MTRAPGAARAQVYEKFRDDGWPLCPRCGEDELYVLENWPTLERPPLAWFVERIDGCYSCPWKPTDKR